jgi:hypothetical protein
MTTDQKSEVEALCKQAQKILLHEMTEDERLFVTQLGWDDHATLPEEKLARLRELVRKKANKPSAA